MAFRLQSAIAGAAKVASQKMRAFDEDYADTLKNSAANLAKEAADIRKARMASVSDYGNKARTLRDIYGLNDGQIQTVLQNGLEGFESLVSSVRSGAVSAQIAGEKFTPRTFVQNTLFTANPETGSNTTYMSLDDQAAAFAKGQVPNTLDLEGSAATISAGTRRGIFGVDATTARAALGDIGADLSTDYTGPGFAPAPYSYTPPALSAEDAQAIKMAEAKREQTESSTKANEANVKLTDARTADVTAGRKTANQANAIRKQELELAKKIAESKAKLTEAQVLQVEANVDNILTNIANTELSNEQKALELEAAWETGLENALLQNELLRSQILKNGSVTTAKEYAYTALSVADKADQKLIEMRNNDDFTTEDVTAQSALAEAKRNAANNAIAILGNQADEDLLSKINLENTFQIKAKNAALNLNVKRNFSSLADSIGSITAGSYPGQISATAQAIEEINGEYGPNGYNIAAAKRFVDGKAQGIHAAIASYAQGNNFGGTLKARVSGKKVKLPDLTTPRPPRKLKDKTANPEYDKWLELMAEKAKGTKMGDIITVTAPNGNKNVYMMGPLGKWIGYY
jgi:hypothetical protein